MEDLGLLELTTWPGSEKKSNGVTVVFIHGINGHRIRSWTSNEVRSLENTAKDQQGDVEGEGEGGADESDDEADESDDEDEEVEDEDEEDESASGTPEAEDGQDTPPEKAVGEEGGEIGDIPVIDEKGEGVVAAESDINIEKGSLAAEVAVEDLCGMWGTGYIPRRIPHARIFTYGYNTDATSPGSQEIMSRPWIKQVARDLLVSLTAIGSAAAEGEENINAEAPRESNDESELESGPGAADDGAEDGDADNKDAEPEGEGETLTADNQLQAAAEDEEDGGPNAESGEEGEGATNSGVQEESAPMDITPLIFVCHDLGGVILKEMLWIANNERVYLPIAVRTQLVVFFGTPHQEAVSSPWDDLVFDIALASTEVRREVRRQLITAIIKAGGAGVRDVSERFNQLAGQYKVLNFYARQISTTTGSVVVPEMCAIASGPLEGHFPRDENHQTMCVFSDEQDPHLLEIISRMDAVTGKRCQGSFDVRHTFSTREPQRNWPILPPTEPATIDWVTSNQSVVDWLKAETFCVLHVHGQAGSGKTVFAASLEKYLQGSGSGYVSNAVISFSFDRSSYCGRSFENMLESLIRELLSQSPAVDAALEAIHHQINNPPTGTAMWTQEALCLLFSAAVDCFEHPILCIIDGIQDCDGASTDILQFMVRLGHYRTAPVFKLMVTSRDSVTTDLLNMDGASYVDTVFAVDLDDEQVVHDERHRIIKNRLTDFMAPAAASIPAEDTETVIEKFCNLSLSFLEVEFIFKKFQAQVPTVASVLNLRHILDTLAGVQAPLHSIYERNLNFDIGTPNEWAFIERVLPWLVYSEQPLTLNQLGVVQNLEENLNCFSTEALENVRSKDIAGILQHTLGSLIVIDNDRVVFAHDTVEDFLEKHPRLCQNVADAAKVHARIASKCLQYLTSSELHEHPTFVENSYAANAKLALPKSASGAYEFLTYAAHHWPTHYRLGTASGEDSENLFSDFKAFVVSAWRLNWWQELFHFLETDSLVSKVAERMRIENLNDSPLKMASFFGLVTVVRGLLNESVSSGEPPDAEVLRSCLQICAWNDHLQALEAIVTFLSKMDDNNTDWDPENLAIRIACAAGNLDIVRLLLREQPVVNLCMCLRIAAGAGHPKVVEVLVETGADVNNVDVTKKTSLHYAAENGYYQVVKQLLNLGAELSTADDDGYTALHFAAMNGHLAAVRVLLSQPECDIDTKRWSIKPLHLAAKNGHVALVKELLTQDPPADVTVTDADGSTPLHLAAQGGYSKSIKLLLDAGADACAADKSGVTPLHLASATSSLKAVDLLLDAGADPDAATYESRQRPLHSAATSGNISILRKLLNYSAAIDPVKLPTKLTPLHLAAYYEHADCVEALLEAGADPHLKIGQWTDAHPDADEMTPLHLAWGHTGVIQTLLKYSTEEAKSFNAKGHTPFFYAFANHILESCRLLLAIEPSCAKEFDHDHWRPIHNATQSGSIPFMQLLLDYGADLDEPIQNTSTTPIFIALAAHPGKPETLSWLIEHGADFRKKDHTEWTPLHMAASIQDFESMKILIDAGADVNAVDDAGWRVIHRVAKDGQVEALKYILEKGADIHVRDNDNWTPLLFACGIAELETLKILIQAGDDVHAVDNEGWTPLHRAAKADETGDSVRLLIENSANIHAKDKDHWTPLHFAAGSCQIESMKALIEAGAEVNAVDDEGYTPLHRAANIVKDNSRDCIKYLIDMGANIEARENDGWSPLHFLAKNGNLEGMKLLVELGVDLEIATEDMKWTPLHRAARDGKEECVQYLLEKGADISARDNDGWVPLFAAAWGESVPVLRLLLEHGAPIDAVDNEKWTALHATAQVKFLEGALFLLEKGADIESRTALGDTALARAATSGSVEMMKLLVEKGADLHTRNNKGDNLIRLAMTVRERGVEVLQYLIDAGLPFDIDERDNAGRTYLFTSAAAGLTALTEFLIERGADKNAVDEVGRTALDVCLDMEVRGLLGADLKAEEGIDRTCVTLQDGENNSRSAFCDVCMGDAMVNEFFYHCCTGECNDPENGAFVACVPCYDKGGRCRNPAEHTMLLRYMGQSMESLEEYSPWVKTLTVPKDIVEA